MQRAYIYIYIYIFSAGSEKLGEQSSTEPFILFLKELFSLWVFIFLVFDYLVFFFKFEEKVFQKIYIYALYGFFLLSETACYWLCILNIYRCRNQNCAEKLLCNQSSMKFSLNGEFFKKIFEKYCFKDFYWREGFRTHPRHSACALLNFTTIDRHKIQREVHIWIIF